ncbi:MAG: hypothetical protein R6V12_07930 [Candidatus Hydrogenedentota bacterium]
MGKRVLVIYHFFYPDDVVSARHLSDLAAGLVQRGWEVTALTSNRFCREPTRRIKPFFKIRDGQFASVK